MTARPSGCRHHGSTRRHPSCSCSCCCCCSSSSMHCYTAPPHPSCCARRRQTTAWRGVCCAGGCNRGHTRSTTRDRPDRRPSRRVVAGTRHAHGRSAWRTACHGTRCCVGIVGSCQKQKQKKNARTSEREREGGDDRPNWNTQQQATHNEHNSHLGVSCVQQARTYESRSMSLKISSWHSSNIVAVHVSAAWQACCTASRWVLETLTASGAFSAT